jgi:hypothetical protein
MQCAKCNYTEPNIKKIFNIPLCKICATFAPNNKEKFQTYIQEKIDWKILDTFRNNGQLKGEKQKQGMQKTASIGKLNSRPPFGYDAINGNLIPNQDQIKIRSLYKTFLAQNYSLKSLAKNYDFSINGLKKILTNRTYLGEIKFDHKIHKGTHQPIINPEIFYATQRKLKTYLHPRKK